MNKLAGGMLLAVGLIAAGVEAGARLGIISPEALHPTRMGGWWLIPVGLIAALLGTAIAASDGRTS